MRSLTVAIALAASALMFTAQANAQELPPLNAAPAVSSPSSPAPAPSSSSSPAPAAADRRRDVVREYVLYRGAFEDENKQALYSDEDRMVVELHRAEEVRNAYRNGMARPRLSMSVREVVYPLDAKGKRQALG